MCRKLTIRFSCIPNPNHKRSGPQQLCIFRVQLLNCLPKPPSLIEQLEYACDLDSAGEPHDDLRNHPCPKCLEIRNKIERERDSEDDYVDGGRDGEDDRGEGWERGKSLGHAGGRNRFGGRKEQWEWKTDSYGDGGRWLEEGEEGSLEEVHGC